MTDPMSPADVPQRLVDAANQAAQARVVDQQAKGYINIYDAMRYALAAVLPTHEQQVRERVAAELRAVMFPCPTHGDAPARFDTRCIGCQRYAALVGAERLIAGCESPSAKAVREMRQGAAIGDA